MARKRKRKPNLDKQLLMLAGQVWAYCRETRNSCDSERHVKAVYDMFMSGFESAREEVGDIRESLTQARKELAAARRKLRSGKLNSFTEWAKSPDGKRHLGKVGANGTSLQAAFLAGAKIENSEG